MSRLSVRLVVAMRMPSSFSISSKMMFWRLLNSASASLKSRMGFCFSFSQSLR